MKRFVVITSILFTILVAAYVNKCAAVTCEWKNLALKKPTRTSSVYTHYGRLLEGKYAVDGDRQTTVGRLPNQNCWHSAGGKNRNWWIVDLGRKAFINHVTIFNRGDCCAERLTGTTVAVANVDPTGTWPPSPVDICGTLTHPVGAGKTWTVHCYNMASKVVVYKPGLYETLCEVEVYGI